MPLSDGVPMFLDQLVDELRCDSTARNTAIAQSALQHGHDLFAKGFTVSQVVHEYGDICQAVTELAIERNAPISTDDFRRLNRCLDDAIAGAVTEYGRERVMINRYARAEDQRRRPIVTLSRFVVLRTSLRLADLPCVMMSKSRYYCDEHTPWACRVVRHDAQSVRWVGH